MKNWAITMVTAGLLLSCFPLTGCDDKVAPAESPQQEKVRADNGAKLRTYFDKVNGNFEALSPEDKAEVIKLVGNEENAKKSFSMMVPNRGAGGTGGGLPPSGPPGR
jgi:hypothetical protein